MEVEVDDVNVIVTSPASDVMAIYAERLRKSVSDLYDLESNPTLTPEQFATIQPWWADALAHELNAGTLTATEFVEEYGTDKLRQRPDLLRLLLSRPLPRDTQERKAWLGAMDEWYTEFQDFIDEEFLDIIWTTRNARGFFYYRERLIVYWLLEDCMCPAGDKFVQYAADRGFNFDRLMFPYCRAYVMGSFDGLLQRLRFFVRHGGRVTEALLNRVGRIRLNAALTPEDRVRARSRLIRVLNVLHSLPVSRR
jgi:hypothetical protein